MSENTIDEDSEGLRELGNATAVVDAEGRETSLEREVMLSDALFERRRWNGLRCAREAMELSRFMELRRDSDEGATSLERDLRDGILVPSDLWWLEIVGVEVVVSMSCVASKSAARGKELCVRFPAGTSLFLPS